MYTHSTPLMWAFDAIYAETAQQIPTPTAYGWVIYWCECSETTNIEYSKCGLASTHLCAHTNDEWEYANCFCVDFFLPPNELQLPQKWQSSKRNEAKRNKQSINRVVHGYVVAIKCAKLKGAKSSSRLDIRFRFTIHMLPKAITFNLRCETCWRARVRVYDLRMWNKNKIKLNLGETERCLPANCESTCLIAHCASIVFCVLFLSVSRRCLRGTLYIRRPTIFINNIPLRLAEQVSWMISRDTIAHAANSPTVQMARKLNAHMRSIISPNLFVYIFDECTNNAECWNEIWINIRLLLS